MTSQEGHSGDGDTQGVERGEEEFEMALRYEKGEGVAQDLSEAAKHLQQAVRLNHTGAMVKLAKAYQCGCGVACDFNKAVRLWKKAASMGNNDAMDELAHWCSQGCCTDVDKGMVKKRLTEEAKEGNREAMFMLGTTLFDGDGVEDKSSAIDLWKQASTTSVSTILMLGRCYEDGDGVDKDVVEAVRLLTIGAHKGDEESMVRLAWHHENGGV